MRRVWPGFVGWVVLVVAGTAAGEVWPDLSVPPGETGGGREDAALVVGIEDYWQLPDIPGAAQNARDWYAFLTGTLGVKPSRATLLLDDEATDAELRHFARQRAADVGQEGTLWFVFIGHGTPALSGEEGVLVGADARATAASLYERSLPQSEMLALLETGQQSRTVVLLDTCFSGQGADGRALVPGLQPALLSGSWKTDRSTVLTAAQGDQFAGPLPGGDRPAFSYLVLGALRGWGDGDDDGRVTVREAFHYAEDTLRAVVKDRRQEPDAHGPNSGSVLSRGSEPGPDVAAIVLTLSGGQARQPTSSEPAFVPPTDLGTTEFEIGDDTDIVALAAEAARQKAEREALEAREAELERQRAEEAERQRLEQEAIALKLKQDREELERREREVQQALEADRRRRRDEAAAEIEAAAGRDWLALADLREQASPEVVPVVEAFVTKYEDSTVQVDGTSYPVELALVDEARAWLRKHGVGGLGGSVIDAHGYELVAIEPGEFWMGSPSDEKGRDDDETRHKVRLTRGFALGATEVTQGLYRAVTGRNPSLEEYEGVSLQGDRKPVQKVSWLDAVAFCNALSEQEGLTPAYRIAGDSVTWDRDADGYRLPTEAEWEYAARAGGNQLFAGADSYEDVCGVGNVSDLGATQKFDWSDDWSKQCTDRHHGTADVGSYRANAWGLYDMSGNVWEWAWDWYGDYPSGTVSDPTGPSTGSPRVARGGSWSNNPRCARVAVRLRHAPGYRYYYLGFRLARSLP